MFVLILSHRPYNDHNPPHFNAEYGPSQMVVDAKAFAVISGCLPPREESRCMAPSAPHNHGMHRSQTLNLPEVDA